MRSPNREPRGGEQGVGSSWSLGFGGRETDHRNQGRADRVRALVLVSRGGKRACWVMRLGRRGIKASGQRCRLDQQEVFCGFFQEINRKLPSIVLTPPGRTASQNLLVSWFLSSHQVAVKLIGIKCFTTSCLSTVVIFHVIVIS